MKKILLGLGLLASVFTFGQSNEAGTIHVGIQWASVLGGATFKTTYTDPDTTLTFTDKGIGAKGLFGVRGSYGISEKISVGGYIRREHAAYVSTDLFSIGSTVVSGIGIGTEMKFYFVNKDRFNMYAAPSVGYSMGKTYYSGFATETYKANGLSYGVNLGLNWYFTDMIGISFDLGYAGGMLKVKDEEGDAKVETKITNGGLLWGVGLVGKFGGK
jgi:hypothetical protein